MKHRRPVVHLLVFAVVTLALSSSITRPTTTGVASQFASFQNTTAIEIPSTCFFCQQGPAKPYPSTIEVSGFKPGSVVSALVVRLKGLTHESPDDVDVLLAAPDSVSSVILSDVGGTANAINKDIVLDFSFSGQLMPDDDPWDPGTVYSPTNRPLAGPADPFALPAPQNPLHPGYLTYGRPANGTWRLYIMDDSNDAVAGSLGGGWQLDIWTNEPPIIALPSDPPVFVEDGPPVALDPDATVVDVDTTDYAEGSLSVSWSNTSSADELRIRNQGTGPGLIGIADDRVLYSGTPFATFVAGAGTLAVTFDDSTAPTVAAVQALVRSLVFEVDSENPSTSTRSVTIVLASHDNVDGSAQATTTVRVRATPDAPTISPLGTQTINEDASTAALPFTVADADSPVAQLSVSAKSSRPRLLPKSGIVLDGSGASRTIKLTPAPNANGKATVTISVSDGDVTSTSNFDVVVRSVPDPTQLSVRKTGSGGGTVTSVPGVSRAVQTARKRMR